MWLVALGVMMLEVLFACVCDRWMMVVRDPSCASVCYLRYVVACVCERCLACGFTSHLFLVHGPHLPLDAALA